MLEITSSAIRYVTAICALPSIAFAAAGEVTKERIELSGLRHDYFVFAPKGLSQPAPVLVLLHGSDRNGKSQIDPWKKLAEHEGVILIAPNAQNPAAWQNPLDGPEALVGVVEAVKKQFAVDSNRVYLFGHSAGAVFALLMPLWEPRYFAAVAVHAGAVPAGSESQVRRAAAKANRKTPIQIQAGTQDPFFPLAAVRTTRDLLIEGGFPVELVEIPRHGHNYYAISERVNRDAWMFLKDKAQTASQR